MQTLPRTLVTGLIILVVIVGLGSLAYPSVQVPVYHTVAFSNTSSYTYLETMFTVLLVPYSTAMTTLVSYYYQPGNFPGCDPASSACNYGIPKLLYVTYSTTTYSQFSTSFYQLSSTTRSIFTSKLTDTNYSEHSTILSPRTKQLTICHPDGTHLVNCYCGDCLDITHFETDPTTYEQFESGIAITRII